MCIRDSLTEMQIGPYLDLRHWWEYVYGKEFFDELVYAILDVPGPVYSNPRENEELEYFCTQAEHASESTLGKAVEIV